MISGHRFDCCPSPVSFSSFTLFCLTGLSLWALLHVTVADAATQANKDTDHVRHPAECGESTPPSWCSGSDIGAWINAANQASSLTEPSSIVVEPGVYTVTTPIVIDRPISLEMTGARLIPGPSLASAPVRLDDVKLTAGSKTVTVDKADRLKVGMRVGGVGLPYGAVIASISGDKVDLSLEPNLVLTCFVTSGRAVLTGCNSLTGVEAGQEVSGSGIADEAKISSIDYADQSITMSTAAVSTPATLNGQVIPVSVAIGGSWTADINAVQSTPVITFAYNAKALQNEFNQMIGASMRGVWIADSQYRSVTGISGVKVTGYDRFDAYNTTIENVNGSGLIVQGWCESAATCGRMSATRESYFYNTKIRYSGTNTTGQSALEIMSGPDYKGSGQDEINQLGFSGGQLVDDYGEFLTVGTYNARDTGSNGPRLIWFSNNFQIESGNYLDSFSNAQYDLVHLERANSIFFDGAELAGSGYGKALIRVDAVAALTLHHALMTLSGPGQSYRVHLANGSTEVTKDMSSKPGQWVTDGSWDGIAAEVIDDAECPRSKPCVVYLSPKDAVPSNTSLKLAVPYRGTTTSMATLVVPASGSYGINATGYMYTLFVSDNFMNAVDFPKQILAFSNAYQPWYVGNGFVHLPPYGEEQQYTGAVFIPQLSANAITSHGVIAVGGGETIVYRCTSAGKSLPSGALTTNASDCGASQDTGLRTR